MSTTTRRSAVLLGLQALGPWSPSHGQQPGHRADCIAPAKAGGGFDLTCKLAAEMLAGSVALATTYMPGGIGAVAFTTFASKRRAEPRSIVAFSSGSLLNLAQGKFGPYSERDARWLAVLGVDYGVIAVRKDSPFNTLGDLAKALKNDPRSVAFGAGGTIGSQDWFKAALFAAAAGVNYKSVRFVAFEGGGEALAALQGGHVNVVTGDAAEASQILPRSNGVRLLAVLSAERLPGLFAGVPTAREQGFDLVWPIARGFYLGPDVDDGHFKEWTAWMQRAMDSDRFATLPAKYGLYPLSLTGPELAAFIQANMKTYRELATQFQLNRVR